MSNLEKNAAFADLESLLDADMDDLEGLPPMGTPPTGHYNLLLTMKTGDVNDKEAVIATYEVVSINEIKDEEEAGDVKVGQTFNENFILKKKDGKANTTSIGALISRLEPFKAHFGTSKVGETVDKVVQVLISASIRRVPQKDNPEFYNARLSDIVIL